MKRKNQRERLTSEWRDEYRTSMMKRRYKSLPINLSNSLYTRIQSIHDVLNNWTFPLACTSIRNCAPTSNSFVFILWISAINCDWQWLFLFSVFRWCRPCRTSAFNSSWRSARMCARRKWHAPRLIVLIRHIAVIAIQSVQRWVLLVDVSVCPLEINQRTGAPCYCRTCWGLHARRTSGLFISGKRQRHYYGPLCNPFFNTIHSLLSAIITTIRACWPMILCKFSLIRFCIAWYGLCLSCTYSLHTSFICYIVIYIDCLASATFIHIFQY